MACWAWALCWKMKRLRRSVLSGEGVLFTLFRLPTRSWLPPSRTMSPTLGPGTSTLQNSMEAPPQKNKKLTTASSYKAGWTTALRPCLGEILYLAYPHHRVPWHAVRTAGMEEAGSTHTGTNPAPPAPADGAGPEAADGGTSELRSSWLVPTSVVYHIVAINVINYVL